MRKILIVVLFMFAVRGVLGSAIDECSIDLRRDRRIQPAHPNNEPTGTHCFGSRECTNPWARAKTVRAETSTPE